MGDDRDRPDWPKLRRRCCIYRPWILANRNSPEAIIEAGSTASRRMGPSSTSTQAVTWYSLGMSTAARINRFPSLSMLKAATSR